MTRHVSADGRTAIAYAGAGEGGGEDGGPDADPLTRPCDRLAVFDMDTGDKLWDARLDGAGSSLAVDVTMMDGAVVAAWGQGSAAYELTGGKRLWADTDPSACADKGFAGGRGLLGLLSCGDSANPTYRVQKIAPRTGDAEWTYRVARGVQSVSLRRARRRRERLYLSEAEHVVSYDLATGRTAGKFDAPAGGEMHPLRMSGEQLIAYRPGRDLGPDAVVALDPGSRKETPLLLFAGGAEVGGLDDPAHNDIVYEHGRAFFAARTVVGPYDEGEVGEVDQVAVGVESAG